VYFLFSAAALGNISAFCLHPRKAADSLTAYLNNAREWRIYSNPDQWVAETVGYIQSEWSWAQQRRSLGVAAAPFNEARHIDTLGGRLTEPWLGLIGTRNDITWDAGRLHRALTAMDDNVSVEIWLESERIPLRPASIAETGDQDSVQQSSSTWPVRTSTTPPNAGLPPSPRLYHLVTIRNFQAPAAIAQPAAQQPIYRDKNTTTKPTTVRTGVSETINNVWWGSFVDDRPKRDPETDEQVTTRQRMARDNMRIQLRALLRGMDKTDIQIALEMHSARMQNPFSRYATDFVDEATRVAYENNTRRHDATQYRNAEAQRLSDAYSNPESRKQNRDFGQVNAISLPVNMTDLYEVFPASTADENKGDVNEDQDEDQDDNESLEINGNKMPES
jgi:hypothetical protein